MCGAGAEAVQEVGIALAAGSIVCDRKAEVTIVRSMMWRRSLVAANPPGQAALVLVDSTAVDQMLAESRGIAPVVGWVAGSRKTAEMLADPRIGAGSLTSPVPGFALIYGRMKIHLAVAGSRCTSLRRDIWCFCKVKRNKAHR